MRRVWSSPRGQCKCGGKAVSRSIVSRSCEPAGPLRCAALPPPMRREAKRLHALRHQRLRQEAVRDRVECQKWPRNGHIWQTGRGSHTCCAVAGRLRATDPVPGGLQRFDGQARGNRHRDRGAGLRAPAPVASRADTRGVRPLVEPTTVQCIIKLVHAHERATGRTRVCR